MRQAEKETETNRNAAAQESPPQSRSCQASSSSLRGWQNATDPWGERDGEVKKLLGRRTQKSGHAVAQIVWRKREKKRKNEMTQKVQFKLLSATKKTVLECPTLFWFFTFFPTRFNHGQSFPLHCCSRIFGVPEHRTDLCWPPSSCAGPWYSRHCPPCVCLLLTLTHVSHDWSVGNQNTLFSCLGPQLSGPSHEGEPSRRVPASLY